MRKIAVFVEGQSEQIFVRSLLQRTADLSALSFGCWRLYHGQMTVAPYSHTSPVARVYFLIVDVGGDGNVLTAVKDRECLLFSKGYQRIIALRDMYSQAYDRRSGGRIDDAVTRAFVDGALCTIRSMKNASSIALHFAVMELEAWFLGMHHVLQRAFEGLTEELVETKLGFRLSEIDPQTRFYRPSRELDSILRLVGASYSKTRGCLESICSRITARDVSSATASGRCRNLERFSGDIRSCFL